MCHELYHVQRLGILQGNARGMTAFRSLQVMFKWKITHVWRERNGEMGVREVVLDLACEQ
ncbi:hypothetical protein QQP08_003487, partial [Theobroma cacao]